MVREQNCNINVVCADSFNILYHDDKLDVKLRNSIDSVLELLKENPYAGNRIIRNRIPSYYNKYKIKILFRIALDCGWRLMYTIIRDDIDMKVFVLDALNHKEYERRFNY